jgi:HPt (histidine-containing phosphotransfer) domain-containing protein
MNSAAGPGESVFKRAPIDGILDDQPMADLVGNIGADGVKQVYSMYLADAEKLLRRMRQAVENADRNSVVDAAHQLKATSGSVGAIQVSKKSGAFEQSARTADPAEWEAMRQGVETAFRLVEIELKRRL